MAAALASRLCGSADIYQRSGKEPLNSINFVTCHDGFTLNDLVSYDNKHNEANGEGNRDGTDASFSRNYGVEGDTDDPAINAVRLRQIKNLIATLLLSRGVPMLLGGDEFRRTQRGNNNAYCQDNDLSWYDWRLLDRNRELFRFTKGIVAFRRQHPVLCEERFFTEEEVSWFNPAGTYPDWNAPSGTLGCLIRAAGSSGKSLCLLANSEMEAVEFHPPFLSSTRRWRLAIDTAAAPPNDIAESDTNGLPVELPLRLAQRSLVMLVEETL